MPGQPRWLQRHKINRAKKRGKVARWVRCKIGWHNPPWNEPVDDMGAIMIGGTCTRCPDPEWREVTWLGNIWDFPSGISQEGNHTTVHGGDMNDAIQTYLHDLLA